MKLQRTLRRLLSLLLAASLLAAAATPSWAYLDRYNAEIGEIQNVTKVENQESEAVCLAYALLAAAGSFCIRNLGMTPAAADFDEAAFLSRVGDVRTLDATLFAAGQTPLGSGCYLAETERLTGRGDRYLKQKIKENGAVLATIALPAGGMTDAQYYDTAQASFYCPEAACDGEALHAIAIVGWDDAYSFENFAENPHEIGAWLCKNSYGEVYGAGGYFWLSYQQALRGAAALTVLQSDAVAAVRTPDWFWLPFFRLGGVGFSCTQTLRDAEIIVTVNGKALPAERRDLAPGAHFLALDEPIRAKRSTVSVQINGAELPQSQLRCYLLRGNAAALSDPNPAPTPDWAEQATRLYLDLTDASDLTARSTDAQGRDHYHRCVRSEIDGKIYITPLDGFYFMPASAVTSFRILQYTDPERPRTITLRNKSVQTLADWMTLLPDGRLCVDCSAPADSAYLTGLDLYVDDQGRLTGAALRFGRGAREDVPVEIAYYLPSATPATLAEPGEPITAETLPQAGTYFAALTVEGFYAQAESFTVTVNGRPCLAEITAQGTTVRIGVEIEIPPVEREPLEILADILRGAWLLELLRSWLLRG